MHCVLNNTHMFNFTDSFMVKTTLFEKMFPTISTFAQINSIFITFFRELHPTEQGYLSEGLLHIHGTL